MARTAHFPSKSWNQTDRVETDLNRIKNYLESFNKTFADDVGHSNPTIFNFLSAVQLEQASTETGEQDLLLQTGTPASQEEEEMRRKGCGNFH